MVELDIDDATPEELAAIAIVLDNYLQAEQEAAEHGEDSTESWDGKRFAYAGRIEALTGTPRRVPRGAPTDNWTAAGRLENL
jgi:hypothetical protein